ncbi:A disintegrin and metalloproteinase with thrombospondin motifs 18-like isoform X2 [Mercenaria mercenaria]|uniref:A disintegrin and metalloproteinase with thrombospondin motifs 18-like isoform X2 n=1 Tax=Mercenaria mercenaria TaxID=6596 RepID=UPI00234E65EA|nr:A disintegrin and metalloproteinase with thrombospondin motifs 18-like isoform X2 [Mercenaria mercenaria]
MGCLNKLHCYTSVVLCYIVLQICAIESSHAVDSEEHIRRRSLREDGYNHVQTASLKFIYKDDEVSHSFTSSQFARDADHQGEPIELHIEGDDIRFEIILHRTKPDFSKDARVVVISDGNEQISENIQPRDCLMSGSLKRNPDNTAVISICDGLKGEFTNGSYTYLIETVQEGGKETVLLARKDNNVLQETNQPSSDDIPSSNIGERQKRAAIASLNIETVLIVDEEYVQNIRDAGHTTNQSIVDLMKLKWTGVQSEWAKSDVLDYEVTIDIKEIVIWEQNPSWYSPSTELDDTLYSICNGAKTRGLWSDYDHIHLFTGRSGTDVSGKAYTPGICIDGDKCAVSTDTSIAEYYVATHELGHNLNMQHDGDVGCPSPNNGIMGGLTSGWSTCSVAAFKELLNGTSADCLLQTDVSESTIWTLEAVWPGMTYSDDEICQLQNGAGFVYVGSLNSCSGYRCMNLDPTSQQYGVSFRYTAPTDGRYCGEDMVCTTSQANYRCINVTDTGIDPSLINKVTGGWSEWGTMTSCSRTCGNGVQYRIRTCDNPKPQNSAFCEGDAYDAELCNTQPCDGDSSVEADLITQRAGETCTKWKTDNMYSLIGLVSANYLNTGAKSGNSDEAQCNVVCDTVDGYAAASSERHGIIPHGTPCSHSSLSTFVENNNLPRKSDMYGTCVQGYCFLFGCDHTSGNTQKDGCGVCGGDNSTCQIVEGVYDTVIAKSERARIVRLPTNSTLIQVYFVYSTMQNHYLELKTKDTGSQAVISYQTLITTSTPVSFAGTHWYFAWNKQYMYAQGPLNQAADIWLFNNGNNNNAGVTYTYSLPTASEMASCSGTCENGGTWNPSTCSCDCADGYYGISCDTTCNKFCKNSQSLSISGCGCDCQGNTYGSTCSCKNPFTGIDCQDCKVSSCQNGGTFNATACRCSCPQGYGDLDCSSPCEDAGLSTEDCLVKVGNGHCESKNEIMETKCYKSCGLCEPSDSTTSSTSTASQSGTGTTGSQSGTGTTASPDITTVNCTDTNDDTCNGAGSLLAHWSHYYIPLQVSLLIHWSPWLLLTQSLLSALLLL